MPDKEKALILVVDDNAQNLQVLGNILRENNYRTAVAQSGPDALDFVQKRRPSLILLDIMMPGMDGLEVCSRLMDDPANNNLPVIFISVHTATEEKLKAFKAGGVDYISKPFQQEEILARIKVHLQLQQTREDLKRINEDLEQRVQERTAELTAVNRKLEETNIALRVLLERNDEHKKNFAQSVMFNVKQLVQPNLEKLRHTSLQDDQLACLDMIENHLQEIISPLKRDLSYKYGFTPAEMQLIEYIKQGKITKEIAAMLNLSKRTIDTHRHNIRKKLGILNQRVNLRNYLMSLDEHAA